MENNTIFELPSVYKATVTLTIGGVTTNSTAYLNIKDGWLKVKPIIKIQNKLK